MANVELRNRVKMTTATVGTGTITLGAAVTSYQTFAAAGIQDGETTRYLIEDGNNWEYGYGVYTSVGPTLTRNALESSSGPSPSGDIGSVPATKIALTGAGIVSITVGAEDFRGRWHQWVAADYMVQHLTLGPARGLVAMAPYNFASSTLDFDPVLIEHAHFMIGMPPGYNGSKMPFIPVWSHAATVTNFGVSWKLKGRVCRNGDGIDTLGTEQESADTGGVANTFYIGPESPQIVLGNSPGPGEQLMALFDIYRDGADTQDNLAIDARLHGVWIIWSSNMATDGLGFADGTPPP